MPTSIYNHVEAQSIHVADTTAIAWFTLTADQWSLLTADQWAELPSGPSIEGSSYIEAQFIYNGE